MEAAVNMRRVSTPFGTSSLALSPSESNTPLKSLADSRRLQESDIVNHTLYSDFKNHPNGSGLAGGGRDTGFS